MPKSPRELAERFIKTGTPFSEEERKIFYAAINKLLPYIQSESLWNTWLMLDRETRDPLPTPDPHPDDKL